MNFYEHYFLSSQNLLPYNPPLWLQSSSISSLPTQKLSLGRFPTPVHPWRIDRSTIIENTAGLEFWIKRDDLTSFDLSGNKVRKLEFLLAEALKNKHDSVITIGGIQSNHARATAVAAKQLGLDPYLILRTPSSNNKNNNDDKEDIGLTGNLLFNRMVGANIHTVSLSTYVQVGSEKLLEQLSQQLKSEGKNPYVIPVGGSNAIGAFGYIECVREIIELGEVFDHIVFACGSGGTAAGLAIGVRLSGLKTKLHAVGVCDSPDYFYNHIKEVAIELNVDFEKYGPVQEWCSIYPGQGIGYAKSTSEELSFLLEVSTSTGIVLDPVYSGKAFYYFVNKVIKENPNEFKCGQKVLFIHTGGTLGLYDKVDQLLQLLPQNKVTKMKVTNPNK